MGPDTSCAQSVATSASHTSVLPLWPIHGHMRIVKILQALRALPAVTWRLAASCGVHLLRQRRVLAVPLRHPAFRASTSLGAEEGIGIGM